MRLMCKAGTVGVRGRRKVWQRKGGLWRHEGGREIVCSEPLPPSRADRDAPAL